MHNHTTSTMPPSPDMLTATRHHQMFPVLEASEIGRIAQLGERRTYAADTRIFTTGEVAAGAFVLLSGRVDITQRDRHDEPESIVTHGPGSFMGELAQLSGRPSLVDGIAKEPVEALVIPPSRLRDLLVEEAELGERIMRALILRRMRLLRSGAGGPIIVGGADNADVLRLENFLDRNSHPHQQLDPNSDLCAHALIERFHITSRELPIVLCPNGAILRNPTDVELARYIGMVTSLDQDRLYDVAIVGAGPRALPRRSMRRPRGCRLCPRLSRLWWTGRRLGAHRELSWFSDRHQRRRLDGASLQPGAKIRRGDGDPRRGRPAGYADRRRLLSIRRWPTPNRFGLGP